MKTIARFSAICAVSAAACLALADEAEPKLSAIDLEFGELSSELVELNSNFRDKQAKVDRLLSSPAADSDKAKEIRKRISELKAELAEAENALREERANNPGTKKLMDELEEERAAIQGKFKRLAELKKLREEAAEAAKPNKPVSKTSHEAPAD